MVAYFILFLYVFWNNFLAESLYESLPPKHNVWCIKNRTIHSSNALLSLVRILMHQRLHFKISVICSCHLNYEERSRYILCISCFYKSLIQFAYYRIWIHKSILFTKALLSYQSTDQTKSKMNYKKFLQFFTVGKNSALLCCIYCLK